MDDEKQKSDEDDDALDDTPKYEFEDNDDGSVTVTGIGKYRIKSGRESEFDKIRQKRGGMNRISKAEIASLLDPV